MRLGTSRLPVVTQNLLVINLIVWLSQLALPRIGFDVTWHLGMHYMGSDHFKIWQLVTYMFLHGNFGHIFSNMFALFMFGGLLEQVWGQRKFITFYLVTGIGAGLIQQLSWFLTMTPEIMYYQDLLITIGASGAIFGILLAFGMLFPNAPIFIMFIPIPIKAKWFVMFYGLFELFAGVSSTGDGIAHFAHLGGMLFGFILIKYWEKEAKKKQRDGWQDFY